MSSNKVDTVAEAMSVANDGSMLKHLPDEHAEHFRRLARAAIAVIEGREDTELPWSARPPKAI